jgi:hypothetical protein
VGGPALTHIMYVGDIMLVAKANSREASVMNKCLEKYCEWSRQRVNRNKLGLIFSKFTQRPKAREVKALL